MDLEFCTNEELILELTKRATFAGLIVCSSKEKKDNEIVHDDWGIYSSLNLEQTKIILKKAEQTVTHGEN